MSDSCTSGTLGVYMSRPAPRAGARAGGAMPPPPPGGVAGGGVGAARAFREDARSGVTFMILFLE